MIIEKVDPSRECFSDYSLDGVLLNIGGVIVDLEEEESDNEVIISFGKCNGMVHRGLTPLCTYVAEAVIPPRRYTDVEVEDVPVVTLQEDDEGEEERNTHTESVPIPLDIDSVVLKLWPVEGQIENQEGEEQNAE